MEGNSFFFGFEPVFMEWLQSHLGSVGSFLAQAFTLLGEELVLVGILVFLYWCYDKKFGEFIGTNVVVALVWNPMIKNIFLRRRPYFDHSNVKCLKPVHPEADIYDIAVQGYSFPSGHSTNSAVLYGSLPIYKKNKILTITSIVVPLLVGFSRVMLGVHYPTDVLCGWLLGFGVAFLMAFIQSHVKRQWIYQIIIVLTALPGIFYCKTEDYYTCLGIMIGFFLAVNFEKRFVNFTNTHKFWECLIRIAIGLILYAGLNILLKTMFAAMPLPLLLARTLRYSIVVFLLVGVYPLSFKKIAGFVHE